MSYPYIGSVALGASKASSTITASVVDLTGSALGSQPTRTVRNLGGGAFGISIPDMPDSQTGWVLLQESGTTLAVLAINPREVENADAKVSTRLQPTVAGRTLDVSSTGEAGIDWANVGSPTTTVNLSGTTISTTQAVASVAGAVGSVTAAVDVGTVGGATATVLTPPLATNITQVGGQAIPTPAVAGYLPVDIQKIEGLNPIPDTMTEGTIAAGVWDLATTGHTTSGTFGSALVAAGSAGDPWTTALPGSYGGGTAGNILGNRLDATVASRLATTGYTAPDNTSIAGIKARTDNLPTTPAAVGSAMTLQDGAITSAKVTVGTYSGVATGWIERMDQVWRRFFKPASRTPTQLRTLADNGTTVQTTQAISDDGSGNETQGSAS